MFKPLYIIWNDSNLLSIPIIDEQHRGIVSAINSFHYLVMDGQGMDSIQPTLHALEQLTLLHFRTEEGLFAKTDFPGRAEHVQAHRNFFRQMQAASREAVDSGDSKVMLDFLKKWWLGHINLEDRKYLSHITG
jgi:hemerythrin-like metal-binding protein